MDYDVVIANGVLVGAEGETRADVAIRGETIAAVGPGLAASSRRRRRDHRRDGPPRSSRAGSTCTSTSSFPSAARSRATTGTPAPARRPAAA